MAINSISNAVASYASSQNTKSKTDNTSNTTSNTKDDTAVVYEKSSQASSSASYSVKNSELIASLKKDSEDRVNSLLNMVRNTISGQGQALGTADDVWKFLAGGNFTVTAAAKAEAQEAISEDGYWGVTQTSSRIVDFAKALSGGDSSKAQTLLDAFKKGYEQATKSWGKTLPDISSKTYDAVVKGFEEWMGTTSTESDES